MSLIDCFEEIKDRSVIERNLTGWKPPISEGVYYEIGNEGHAYVFKFVAPLGSNVRAAKDGTIFLINKNNQTPKWGECSVGNRIILDHGEGIYTRYENLSEECFDNFDIRKGKKVKQEEVIGTLGLPRLVGSTPYLLFNGFAYIKDTQDSIKKLKIIPIKFDYGKLRDDEGLSLKERFNCQIA